MRSAASGVCGGGAGYEDVREWRTKTCIHACGPGQTFGCRHLQTRSLPFLRKNPEATGWGGGAEGRNITGRHGGKEEGEGDGGKREGA